MRIKKVLSLLTAAAMTAASMTAFTVTASAAEKVEDFTYHLNFAEKYSEAVLPDTATVDTLSDAEDNTVMTVTYLNDTWKWSQNGLCPGDSTRPKVSSGVYASGCAIQVVPAVNGELLVDYKLASNKTLAVDCDGKAYKSLSGATANNDTKNDVPGYTVDVEANSTYIIYVTGTGNPYYGLYFEPASSSTHVLSGNINYTGNTDTTGWKLVFTDTKDESEQSVDFGAEYAFDATQNRTYNIKLVDAEGNAPEATTITLDTNSVYVGKEDVSFDINVVDFALTATTGDVVVHDINNDGTSLDLSGVTLTFTSQTNAEHIYSTGITDNKISLELMPNEVYDITAAGADGYELSELSKTYSMPAGDMSPFKNILFTEVLGTVDFASTVEVGADKAYAAIGDAITAIKKMQRPAGEDGRVTVLVDPGTYTEQVIVDTDYITIKSANEQTPAEINWYYGIGYLYYSSAGNGYYSEEYAVDKKKKGTVQRWGAACRITGDYVYLENIILRNTFSCEVTDAELADGVEAAKNNEYSDVNGKVERDTEGFDPLTKAAVERAAAIALDGAHAEAYKCEFISSQDTFYTGKAAYIKDCYIEGGTDYIFGGNSVVFDGCTLAWHGYSDQANGGYLTANKNSAAPGSADGNGYLFRNATVTNSKYFPNNQFAAGSWGRNWGGANTQVVFDGVTLDDADVPGAWVKMGGDLTVSVLYVNDITDKDGNAVDAAAYNPNGTMADNGYTEMAAADYFGGWTPPHYEASTEPDKPVSTPEPAKCLKITATYKDGGALEKVETEEVYVTEAKPAEKNGNTMVTYWDSLDSMKPADPNATAEPVVTPTPAAPTQKPVDTSDIVVPEKTVTVGDGVHWKADDMSDGTYNTTQELNGLYIGAGEGINDEGAVIAKAVTVDSAGSSGTTISGTKYLKRIKTGGTGDPATGIRCFYFKVDSDCNLILDATASSGGATRDVVVIHGDKAEQLAVSDKASYPVSDIKAGETVVIYSAEGGLNVYGIKLTKEAIATPAPPSEKAELPANASVKFDAAIGEYANGAVIANYVNVYGTGAIVVDASNKTVNGTKYNARLKMGGNGSFNSDGTPKSRVISVIPAMAGKLSIDFVTSTTGELRSLTAKQGEAIGTATVGDDGIGALEMDVDGDTEVYIYCTEGACNIYGIKLEVDGAPVPVDDSMLPKGTTVTFDSLIDESYSANTKILKYVSIYSNGGAITISSTSKTINGVKYTSALKLGGNGSFNSDGTPKNRVIGVTPAASGKLSVDFITSTTGQVRSLTAKQGDAVQKVSVGDEGTATLNMDVTAGTEVLLYTEDGAVNIYGIALN